LRWTQRLLVDDGMSAVTPGIHQVRAGNTASSAAFNMANTHAFQSSLSAFTEPPNVRHVCAGTNIRGGDVSQLVLLT
jgi:hypothetical protein